MYLLKRVCLPILILLVVTACRKDKSGYINSGGQCLMKSTVSADGKTSETFNYQLDSVLTEYIVTEDGTITVDFYLIVENSKQFIFLSGGKTLQDAISRIYLNQDGSVEKEVAVDVNPDGKTFTEDPTEQNLFTYNAKKQLIRVDATLDEDGIYDFTYDNLNRVQKIQFTDNFGTDDFVFDNFTYETKAKNDNFAPLPIFESMSSFLIPSLRNAYVKSFSFTASGPFSLSFDFAYDYKFTKGKLVETTSSFAALDQADQHQMAVELTCK